MGIDIKTKEEFKKVLCNRLSATSLKLVKDEAEGITYRVNNLGGLSSDFTLFSVKEGAGMFTSNNNIGLYVKMVYNLPNPNTFGIPKNAFVLYPYDLFVKYLNGIEKGCYISGNISDLEGSSSKKFGLSEEEEFALKMFAYVNKSSTPINDFCIVDGRVYLVRINAEKCDTARFSTYEKKS